MKTAGLRTCHEAALPGSRGGGGSGRRTGPGCTPRHRRCSRAAGASGKLLFLPRDLHFCTSRPTRGKTTHCSPPTAPSSALRARSSPGAPVTPGQRLRPQPAPGAAGGAQPQTGQLPLSVWTGPATARVCLQSHSETTCIRRAPSPKTKRGGGGYKPWARWLQN